MFHNLQVSPKLINLSKYYNRNYNYFLNSAVTSSNLDGGQTIAVLVYFGLNNAITYFFPISGSSSSFT